jgi:hypothetical protein
LRFCDRIGRHGRRQDDTRVPEGSHLVACRCCSQPACVRKQIRYLLEGIRLLLERIKKVDLLGGSVELTQQLVNQARPPLQIGAGRSDITSSIATGAYSTDYHAIVLVAGVANPTDHPDQVVRWKLSFPSLGIDLDPISAPQNLVGGVPWWPSPMVKLPANELVQRSLFFRGRGILAEGLPEEPLRERVVAETLRGKELSQDVEVYRVVTLQTKARSASA